jgi:hypothetical protein
MKGHTAVCIPYLVTPMQSPALIRVLHSGVTIRRTHETGCAAQGHHCYVVKYSMGVNANTFGSPQQGR